MKNSKLTIYAQHHQLSKTDLLNRYVLLTNTITDLISDKSSVLITFHTLFNTAFFMTKNVLHSFE